MQKSSMRLFLGLSLATHLILLIWLFKGPIFEESVEPPLSTNIEFEQTPHVEEVEKPEAPKSIVDKIKSIISPNKKTIAKRQKKPTTSTQGIPQKELIYAQKLQAFLEKNRSYPIRALRLKQEGVVKALIIIAKNGAFKNVSILESSNSSILDKYTLRMIKNLQTFKPLPDQNKTQQEFTVPISYKIKK